MIALQSGELELLTPIRCCVSGRFMHSPSSSTIRISSAPRSRISAKKLIENTVGRIVVKGLLKKKSLQERW